MDQPTTAQLHPVPAELLADAGYRHSWAPVYLTPKAWEEAVSWTEQDAANTGGVQDERGRLYDVVWMARHDANRPAQLLGPEPQPFTVLRIARDARMSEDYDLDPTPLRMVIVFDHDEKGMPRFTIGLPDEF